jgi:penicillin-binding protein 1A
LRQGYSPYQVVVDEPVQLGSWKPENYDKKHYGAMTLQEAFNRSNNIVAVKLMEAVGVNSVIELAHKLGVQSTIEPNLSSTLGGSSLMMQELVQSVGAIANQGTRVKPYMIEKIVDADGNVIFQHTPELTPVLEPGLASAMVRLLEGVVQSGTGRAANYGDAIAGKTGTSDGFRDAWFVGFNPNITAGVWVGNDDNTPMARTISGGSMPTQIWHDFMKVASASFEKGSFSRTALPATGTKMLPNSEAGTPLPEEQTVTNPNAEGGGMSPSLEDGAQATSVEEQPLPPPPPRKVDAWSLDGSAPPTSGTTSSVPSTSAVTGTRLRNALNKAKERVANEFVNKAPSPTEAAPPLPSDEDQD